MKNNMEKNYCIPCRLMGLVQKTAPYIINGFSCCEEHENMWADGTMTFVNDEPVNYDIEKWKEVKELY